MQVILLNQHQVIEESSDEMFHSMSCSIVQRGVVIVLLVLAASCKCDMWNASVTVMNETDALGPFNSIAWAESTLVADDSNNNPLEGLWDWLTAIVLKALTGFVQVVPMTEVPDFITHMNLTGLTGWEDIADSYSAKLLCPEGYCLDWGVDEDVTLWFMCEDEHGEGFFRWPRGPVFDTTVALPGFVPASLCQNLTGYW